MVAGLQRQEVADTEAADIETVVGQVGWSGMGRKQMWVGWGQRTREKNGVF